MQFRYISEQVRLPGRWRPGDQLERPALNLDSVLPVAWVTIASVPDPGAVWGELSDASLSTGLVPFIARPLRDESHRPWDDGTHRPDDYFSPPADLAVVDQIDPAVLLRSRWARQARVPTEEIVLAGRYRLDDQPHCTGWAADRSRSGLRPGNQLICSATL